MSTNQQAVPTVDTAVTTVPAVIQAILISNLAGMTSAAGQPSSNWAAYAILRHHIIGNKRQRRDEH
jgi:hypothetical protein